MIEYIYRCWYISLVIFLRLTLHPLHHISDVPLMQTVLVCAITSIVDLVGWACFRYLYAELL